MKYIIYKYNIHNTFMYIYRYKKATKHDENDELRN